MSSSPNRLGPSAQNPTGRESGGKAQIAEGCADRNENGVIDEMIGIAALAVGIVLGLVFHPSVPEVIQPYLPIAVVAALDAVFGGLRAYLERIFDPKVFVVSFVFNVLVAALIVYVGDQLGVGTQLSTAIIVVLGIRIFGNTAALRRRLFGA
jgi:small basic protein